MNTFARPGRALFDYEVMLSQKPRAWPPTTYDAPTLWSRARELWASTIAFVCSAAALAKRWRLGRKERGEILNRILPVEKLVRTLCLVEASTWLLTPEGRALRAATLQVVPSAPPPPTFVAKPTHKTTIPYPGWHTIAALRPRIDPRVTEREAREREALEHARRSIEETKPNHITGSFSGLTRDAFCVSAHAPAAAEPAAARKASRATPETTSRSHQPPHGTCGFRIIGWKFPEPETPPPPRPARRGLFIALIGEDSTFDLTDDLAPIRTRRAKREYGPAASLARRIDALQRVLNNPAPVIRRLVHLLASVPQDDLPEFWLGRAQSLPWWHGRPEAHNAVNLLAPSWPTCAPRIPRAPMTPASRPATAKSPPRSHLRDRDRMLVLPRRRRGRWPEGPERALAVRG